MIANNLPFRAPLNGSANILLRGCAFGALALCLASPAMAQDAQQDTGESASDSSDDVIVVTGLRVRHGRGEGLLWYVRAQVAGVRGHV